MAPSRGRRGCAALLVPLPTAVGAAASAGVQPSEAAATATYGHEGTAEEGPDRGWRKHRMSYPAWMKFGVQRHVDSDFAADPACDQQPRWPVDWVALRHRVQSCLHVIDEVEAGRTQSCSRSSKDLVWRSAVEALHEDDRFSTFVHDCPFGALAVVLCEHTCAIAVGGKEAGASWSKLQVELEAMLLYLRAPWSQLLTARWRLGALFARLGRAVRRASRASRVGAGVECDLADSPEDAAFLLRRREDLVFEAADAEAFISQDGSFFVHMLPATEGEFPHRCPFGVFAAVLSLAIWMAASMDRGGHSGWTLAKSPENLVDLFMMPGLQFWEHQSDQLFFDFFTSHWQLPALLEVVEDTISEVLRPTLVGPSHWPTPSTGPLCGRRRFPRGGPRGGLDDRGPTGALRVLFIGGSSTTYLWTSFTQRGRQLARGLRQLGLRRGADARAWNSGCRDFCGWTHYRAPGDWTPMAIVHVKLVCRCAVVRWPRTVHLFDPVDIFEWNNNLRPGSILLRLDAILLTTSLAAWDVHTHPALRAAGNISVAWLPYHHSNFLRARSRDAKEEVRVVGVHTWHNDRSLRQTMEGALADERAAGRSRARFVHMDPMQAFRMTEGRIITPQQTAELYSQLSLLDISVAKMSGCVTSWWLCSRWRTGQRLANLLSVGVPTVVWGDAQGHLDVIQARWPPAGGPGPLAGGPAPGPGDPGAHYPRELVVADGWEAQRALRALLRNASLRARARDRGFQLAARTALPRVAAQLARLLRRLVCRRAARDSRREAVRWGSWRSGAACHPPRRRPRQRPRRRSRRRPRERGGVSVANLGQ